MEIIMAKKKNKKTKIICTILSFLLAIVITMFSYLTGLYLGLFNMNNLVDSMDADFYGRINEYIRKEAVNIAIPYGVDRTVFDDVFTMDITSVQASNKLKAQLKNENYIVNTSDIEQKIRENIDKFVTSNGYTLTSEQKSSVDTLVQEVCSIYTEALSIPYMQQFARINSTFNKYITIGLIITFIMIIIDIIILFFINKYAHRCFRYIVYATLAAAIMTAFLPIWALTNGFYKRIFISVEYVYTFFVNYLHNSIMIFIYISALLLAVSAALLILIWYRRKALIAHNKAESHRRHELHVQRRMQEEQELAQSAHQENSNDLSEAHNFDNTTEFIDYYESNDLD